MSSQRQLTVQLTILMFTSFIQFSYQQCPTSQCDCTNTSGGIQIICRDKELTDIPTFTDTGVTYDEINFGSTHPTGCSYPHCSKINKISTVPANAFANIRVKKIILTQNAIKSYDVNAFAGLEYVLDHLELEGNGSNAFPNAAVCELTHLQALHLEHFNQQTMTQSNTLCTLPKLTHLTFKKINSLNNIVYNAFYTGPEQAKSPKFPVLNSFHLINVYTLTVLPADAIQELTELTELDISWTGITQINAQAFVTLHKLIKLRITYNANHLTIDSGAFDGLYDTLQFLSLEANNLQSLVSLSTSSWQQLSQLNLEHNPIGIVHILDFSNLGQNLKYLNLDSCKLAKIHSSMFSDLRSLHTLDLSTNELQIIPDSVFQNIHNLTVLRLDMQKNVLTLNDNSFRGIETTLNRLFINDNTIDKPIFWRLIGKLPNLLELRAGNMNLQNIPENAFKSNDKLAILALERNGITTLQDSSFFRLRDTLEVLSISYNSLTTISKCFFNGFTKLQQLYLFGNQLYCDCRLVWLHNWIWQQPDKHLASSLVGPCANPPALADKYLSELSSNDLTCGSGYVEPTCTNLYTTTTTTMTKTTINSTIAPANSASIIFVQITRFSVIVGLSAYSMHNL